jgi:toxin ParE1/3/4
MKVLWSPEAIDDLLSIRQYIEQDHPAAAREIVSAIVNLVEHQLPRFPQSGRAGRVEGTRELIVPRLPFIIPYRATAESIDVLRIYHASRIWPDQF